MSVETRKEYFYNNRYPAHIIMELKALHDARPYIELVHTRNYTNNPNIEGRLK